MYQMAMQHCIHNITGYTAGKKASNPPTVPLFQCYITITRVAFKRSLPKE